jgi:hypothetical protein
LEQVTVPATAASPQQLIIDRLSGFGRRRVCGKKLYKLRETCFEACASRCGIQRTHGQRLAQFRMTVDHHFQSSVQQIFAEGRMNTDG